MYLGVKSRYIKTLPLLSFNTWFLGPTRVHKPNGISIGTAVVAWLTIMTHRQTDHTTPSLTTTSLLIQPPGCHNPINVMLCC